MILQFASVSSASNAKSIIDHSVEPKYVNIMAENPNYKPIIMPMLDGYLISWTQEARSLNRLPEEQETHIQTTQRKEGHKRYVPAIQFLLAQPSLDLDLIKKWFGTVRKGLSGEQKLEWNRAASSYNYILDSYAKLASDKLYIETACPGADPEYYRRHINTGQSYCTPAFNGNFKKIRAAYKTLSPIRAKKNLHAFLDVHYPKFVTTIRNSVLPSKFIIYKKIEKSEYDLERLGFKLTLSCCFIDSDIPKYLIRHMRKPKYALSDLLFSEPPSEPNKIDIPTELFIPMGEADAETVYERSKLKNSPPIFYAEYLVKINPISSGKKFTSVDFEKAEPEVISDLSLFLVTNNGHEKIASLPTK